jgi:hypothetical protein
LLCQWGWGWEGGLLLLLLLLLVVVIFEGGAGRGKQEVFEVCEGGGGLQAPHGGQRALCMWGGE